MQPSPAVDLTGIAQQLQLRREQVENTVELLDAGNTVPFITRYRKERTGNLDEQAIREIQGRVASLRQLAERKATILRSIEAQGKLTDKLRRAIDQASTPKRLEDLYLPYKPKKLTLATVARRRGLEPLAERIWNRDAELGDVSAAAAGYVDPEKELPGVPEVLAGVGHLLAERISETAELRERLRVLLWKSGRLTSTRADIPEGEGAEYRDYFEYSEAVASVPPHRVLAVNRGEREGVLRVRVQCDEGALREAMSAEMGLEEHPYAEFMRQVVADALARLLLPSLEREIRRELSDAAEKHAIEVFARNLRNLLLQPPVHGKRVLAIDPGFRTGCKLVVLDGIGNLLDHGVVYVQGSQEKRAAAQAKLEALIVQHEVQVVAIGNGTACRETEEMISTLIAEKLPGLAYCIVNEAGASVYSTSAIGRQEFPDHDATMRGTISIGRRLQDPLSELVKIEPQHIGVGLYQHDVANKRLRESLAAVVESCVNYVGVELNTASAALLRRVSGFNQLTAQRVVDWRREHGPFQARRQLNNVPGVGDATFQQAAGFLKISGGDNPLDRTWIHPESYPVAEQVLHQLGYASPVLCDKEQLAELRRKLAEIDAARVAGDLGVGVPTMCDILESLSRPGRDPREDLPPPIFKKGVLRLEDLHEGIELKGTVLNVVDFGAFVDIGLKDSGLVHISQLANHYVKSPYDMVAVGDVVTVWVRSIDADRRRVSLTMIPPGTPRKQRAAAREKSEGPPRRRRQRRLRRDRGEPPPPPLSDEVLEGAVPLRSFGELKQLWETKRREGA